MEMHSACINHTLRKPSQPADFFVREKVALTHVKQQTFDCVSQKENVLFNTKNKRIIGVLTSLHSAC
jgi:hypothetical protein